MAYVLKRSIGSPGSGDGQLNNPYGVFVVPADGEVYVSDSGNNRIQVFDTVGNYLRKWGSFGSGNGQFNSPNGICVYGSEVYVCDTGNRRIQVFNTAGVYQRQWGTAGSGNGQFRNLLGVFGYSGEIFTCDGNAPSPNNRVQVFSTGGSYLRKWGSTGSGPNQFDFCEGIWTYLRRNVQEVYVADYGNDRIIVFDLNGVYKREWSQPGAETVSVYDDRVFITTNNPLAGWIITDTNGLLIHDNPFAIAWAIHAVDNLGEEEVYVCKISSDTVDVYGPPPVPSSHYTWVSHSGNGSWRRTCSSDDGSVLAVITEAGSSGPRVSTDGGANWAYNGPSGAANNYGIDCDADGSNMIAAIHKIFGDVSASIYVSTNFGSSWTEVYPTGAPGPTGLNKFWWQGWGGIFGGGGGGQSVASNSDGSRLAVIGHSGSWLPPTGDGRLYTTANGGTSWTLRNVSALAGSKRYYAVRSSSDGSILYCSLAVVGMLPAGALLYKSIDYGATWALTTTQPFPSPGLGYGVKEFCCSDDGSFIFAIVDVSTGFFLFISTDGGTTWTETMPKGGSVFSWWDGGINCNSNGSVLGAAEFGSIAPNGRLYISLDGGATWTQECPIDDNDYQWRSPSFSSDGSKMLIGESGSMLYTGAVSTGPTMDQIMRGGKWFGSGTFQGHWLGWR